MNDFIRIGTHVRENNKKIVFKLEIEDYVSALIPPEGVEMPVFDPYRYFITSGDAIRKATKMSEDLWKYAGEARRKVNARTKLHGSCKYSKKFEERCWEYAGKSKSLIRALMDARGESIFMETEWRHHELLVIPKDPKPRQPMKKKI